jgi:hypothetical protein
LPGGLPAGDVLGIQFDTLILGIMIGAVVALV